MEMLKASEVLETLEILQKRYDPTGKDKLLNDLIVAVEASQCVDCGGFAVMSAEDGQFCSDCLEALPSEEEDERPEIVCLCGSTRFKDAFTKITEKLTLKGKIVLSVGLFMHADGKSVITDDIKRDLDELHKRKIDLADTVFILNVDGYIGESTKSEIEYAERIGKPVYYLETGCEEDEYSFDL